jgi:RNA polymerase sigma factor (sigma-70 family)
MEARCSVPPSGSITNWLRLLPSGDPAAAQKLWERYFMDLVRLARQRLCGTPRRAADEEDVALSAFESFCRGAAQGRFPQLEDRDDLWQVLMVITMRKAFDLVHHERRQKRGGGNVLDEAACRALSDSLAEPLDLSQIVGREPTPAFAAEVSDALESLLGKLQDPQLRSIALFKLEGYTNAEIGAQLGCARRTVRRRLQLIRDTWAQEQPR